MSSIRKSFSLLECDASYITKLSLKLGQEQGKSVTESAALRVVIAKYREESFVFLGPPPTSIPSTKKSPVTYNMGTNEKKSLQLLAIEKDTDMTALLDEAVKLLFLKFK